VTTPSASSFSASSLRPASTPGCSGADAPARSSCWSTSGERTFLPDRAAAAELAQVPAEALDDVAVLHVPAYCLDGGTTASSVRALLMVAADRRIAVSLDASSWAVLRTIGVQDYLALVERVRPAVVFANADEERELGLLVRAPDGVTVVVKDGARATLVRTTDGARLRVPVPPVPGVRDSTGAGDAFAAGWLSAMMDGLDAPARVERAHALARSVLLSPGAGIPTQEVP